jgi:hypothetical protein
MHYYFVEIYHEMFVSFVFYAEKKILFKERINLMDEKFSLFTKSQPIVVLELSSFLFSLVDPKSFYQIRFYCRFITR